MRQAQYCIVKSTSGRGLYDITAEVSGWLEGQPIREGLLTLFIQHTSASLIIQENADPDVLRDLDDFFRRLVPEDDRLYRHTQEGPDDMPAHIRGALTQTQLSVPVGGGRLLLGIWQAIYLFEHRAQLHRRQIVLHLIGD